MKDRRHAEIYSLSILSEPDSSGALIDWAQELRDIDLGWMQVAQSGVTAFAAHGGSCARRDRCARADVARSNSVRVNLAQAQPRLACL